MKKTIVRVVRGSEGYSLQVVDEEGNGERFIGPKAWGNPCNKPTCEFEVDVEEFIKCLERNSFEKQKGGLND